LLKGDGEEKNGEKGRGDADTIPTLSRSLFGISRMGKEKEGVREGGKERKREGRKVAAERLPILKIRNSDTAKLLGGKKKEARGGEKRKGEWED